MFHEPRDDQWQDGRRTLGSETEGSNLSTGTTTHRQVAPDRPASPPSLKFSLHTVKALVDLLKTLEACHVDTSTRESSARPPP